jgi:hypothetical protein
MDAILQVVRKPRRAGFRQADLTRALKAAERAGKHVEAARVGSDGAIELVFGSSVGVASSPEPNDWD